MSTLADQVGHGTFAVMPLFHLIERHVLAAERLHGDDTTIRILAKGKCRTGRIWTYVRDDPFAWLALTLQRIANGWSSSEIDALMPWNRAA
ncbi:hypothetical protein ACVMIH_007517 [Bradyrhizobium sp. USDA 4503]